MAKEKAKEKKIVSGELMIPVEQFRRTRDQIIETLNELQGNLQSVQSGLQNMMTVYLRHSASVLDGGSGSLEPGPHEGPLKISLEDPDAPTEKKRGRKPKKEKKKKDPNAPKRPLTAAFLYSQNARAIVKSDMEKQLADGEKLEGNSVNKELTRRWMEMPDNEKQLWKDSYRDSMEIYKQEVAEYNQQRGIEFDAADLDEEIDDVDAGVIPSDVEGSSSDDSDEDSPTRPKAPTPPVATPKPSKRQKAAKTNGVAPTPIQPATTVRSTVPIPVPGARATSVKPPGLKAASPIVENGKAKSKKAKEPSPEESKKKRSRRNVEEEEVVAAQEPPKKKRAHKKKDP